MNKQGVYLNDLYRLSRCRVVVLNMNEREARFNTMVEASIVPSTGRVFLLYTVFPFASRESKTTDTTKQSPITRLQPAGKASLHTICMACADSLFPSTRYHWIHEISCSICYVFRECFFHEVKSGFLAGKDNQNWVDPVCKSSHPHSATNK